MYLSAAAFPICYIHTSRRYYILYLYVVGRIDPRADKDDQNENRHWRTYTINYYSARRNINVDKSQAARRAAGFVDEYLCSNNVRGGDGGKTACESRKYRVQKAAAAAAVAAARPTTGRRIYVILYYIMHAVGGRRAARPTWRPSGCGKKNQEAHNDYTVRDNDTHAHNARALRSHDFFGGAVCPGPGRRPTPPRRIVVRARYIRGV